jgi:hypothetical protein
MPREDRYKPELRAARRGQNLPAVVPEDPPARGDEIHVPAPEIEYDRWGNPRHRRFRRQVVQYRENQIAAREALKVRTTRLEAEKEAAEAQNALDLVPLEHRRAELTLQVGVVDLQGQLNQALRRIKHDEDDDERERMLRTREYEAELARLGNETARAEYEAAVAEERAKHALEIAALTIDREKARLQREIEEDRRQTAKARQKSPKPAAKSAPAPEEPEGSTAFRQHLEIEKVVGGDRHVADQKMLEIIKRRGGVQNLTPDDTEEIDRLQHARYAAEQDIRSAGAGDFLNGGRER